MSFRLKTIIGIAAIELFVLSILTITNYVNFGGTATTQFVERAQGAAKLFSSVIANSLVALDLATLDAMSANILANPDFVYVRIRNPSGRELSSAGNRVVLAERFHPDAGFESTHADHRYDVSAPVLIAGTSFGSVEIGIDTRRVESAVRRALFWNISISIGGMLLVAVFGTLLGAALTRQLTALRDGATRLAAGEQGYQVRVTGNDELSETAAHFNSMSRSLANERTELALREAEARQLARVAEYANEAIIITHADGRIIWVNRAFGILTGYHFEDVAGSAIDTLLLGPETTARARTSLMAAFEKGVSLQKEILCYAKNRHPFWADINIAPIRADDGSVEQFIIVQRDISDKKEADAELKKMNAALRYNAIHDPLTGLGNRRYLDDVLEKAAVRCANAGRSLALLHIDLDRFKQINDTLGHAAGDYVLQHVAQMLRSVVEPEDHIARVGGDEFVLASSSAEGPKRLSALAANLLKALHQPVRFGSHLCRTGASIGIAVAWGRPIDTKALMVNADIALHRAKAQGRNCFEFFSQDLQRDVVARKRTADDILRGLEHREFIPFYQPQFDAASLDIVGVEALVRWRHPDKGIVQPMAFLAVAEDLNAVAAIDKMLMERALEDLARWRAAGPFVPKVSVNISARRLRDPDLITDLRDLQLEPGRLSFEILESIFLDDDDDQELGRRVAAIKELGIDIEVDDFGTGHASIVSLLKLKPSRMKIDRKLVSSLTRSERQKNLVKAIIEIGLSQGIAVTAEGVESREQVNLLRQMGCTTVQGFYFAQPLSAEDFERFADGNAWRAVS